MSDSIAHRVAAAYGPPIYVAKLADQSVYFAHFHQGRIHERLDSTSCAPWPFHDAAAMAAIHASHRAAGIRAEAHARDLGLLAEAA